MLEAADASVNETDTHCDAVCDYVSQSLRLIPEGQALPRLIALVEKKTDSRWAMNTIGLFGDEAIPVLMKIVRNPQRPNLRDDSIDELSRIGSDRSVTALLPLLNDPDQSIRTAAVDAAKKTTEPRFAPEILLARRDGLCDDECLARYFRFVRYPEALPELRVARSRIPRTKSGETVRNDLDLFIDLAIEKQEQTAPNQ